MGPSEIGFLKGIVVFVLLAGTGLRGFRLWLQAKEQRLAGDAQDAIAQLEEAHARREAALVEELSELQAHVAELDDRLDFAERRLTTERDAPARIEPRHLTPV